MILALLAEQGRERDDVVSFVFDGRWLSSGCDNLCAHGDATALTKHSRIDHHR